MCIRDRYCIISVFSYSPYTLSHSLPWLLFPIFRALYIIIKCCKQRRDEHSKQYNFRVKAWTYITWYGFSIIFKITKLLYNHKTTNTFRLKWPFHPFPLHGYAPWGIKVSKQFVFGNMLNEKYKFIKETDVCYKAEQRPGVEAVKNKNEENNNW